MKNNEIMGDYEQHLTEHSHGIMRLAETPQGMERLVSYYGEGYFEEIRQASKFLKMTRKERAFMCGERAA